MINELAKIKINSRMSVIRRELEELHSDFLNNNGIIDSETLLRMADSTSRELEIYEHIYNKLCEER